VTSPTSRSHADVSIYLGLNAAARYGYEVHNGPCYTPVTDATSVNDHFLVRQDPLSWKSVQCSFYVRCQGRLSPLTPWSKVPSLQWRNHAQAPPQPKLGPSCNSSRSDDFLYVVGGGVRTPTAHRCLPRLAYRLTVRPEDQTNQLSLYDRDRMIFLVTITALTEYFTYYANNF